MILKTLDSFWDTFKHILQQDELNEIKWDIHWMMINYGNLFKNNYFVILNQIIPKLDIIGLDNTKLMLEVILNDEFKGVFNMKKDRHERINSCIKLLKFWIFLIEHGYVPQTSEWKELLAKLQTYRHFSKPLSAEIELIAYGLERAIKANNKKSANNGFINIINMLIKGVDDECK